MNVAKPLLDLAVANDVEEGMGVDRTIDNEYIPDAGRVFQKFTVTGDN